MGDARNVLDDRPAEVKYDLVVGDAFNDLSVPFHLTTHEFNQKVKAHLKDGGVYLVNVIDDWEFANLLAAYVNTLRLTWKHVYVLCTEEEGVKKGRDTFVLAASDRAIDTDDWLPGHWQEFPGSILNDVQMENLLARGNGRVLTDDDPPVENMLAPVVAKRR
ncbi:MAG: fused MFS/spermidine synthase [Planctomycetota bacterium]|nr:fused MFS/spermidine synthase [Planctomycetota bacterium]